MKDYPDAAIAIASQHPAAAAKIIKENPSSIATLINTHPIIVAKIMKDYPDTAAVILKSHPAAAAQVIKAYPDAAKTIVNTDPALVANLMKNYPMAATAIATNYPDATTAILKANPVDATAILKNNPAVSASIVKNSPGAAAEFLDKYPEAANSIMKNSPTPGTASAAMPSDQPNSFLTSAVGGFLGAGFGSLLGSAAGASLSRGGYETNGNSDIQDIILQSVISENAALRLSHDEHHEHAGISSSPNSKHMGRYEELKDTKWTRGGPTMRHEARHRRPSLDRYNDNDPETVRWPGKNLEPTNLHSLRRSRCRSNSEKDDDNCETTGSSEPLSKKFNVERDYSR